MKFTFDPSVQALYIEIKSGEVARTVEMEKDVYVDLDNDSNVLGVEVLDLRSVFGDGQTPVELNIPDQLVAG
ncbi:DUF2283 domain-containing protein [Deinococcus ruber]|uniref:DUF2283 domain-containing protein n=1 Tax=Deinococcus ruber TaxID=1848197 RepID=A0A918CPU1_9DEIO|nr:DUF2283 domain-containing protein [Deinococcus ruber]GGR34079.1 hypothetical protein GCM10008957_50360 [Deinococcus ruber]